MISSPGLDDAQVLLYFDSEGWDVIACGPGLTQEDILAYEEEARTLGGCRMIVMGGNQALHDALCPVTIVDG